MARTHGMGRWAATLAGLLLGGWALAQQPNDKIVAEVVARNNRLIPSEAILNQVKTRKDTKYDQSVVQGDVVRLMATKQFSGVTPYFQVIAEDKVVVIFEVQEYPNLVQEIRYDGAKHLKDDELNAITGLKRGVPLNPIANKLAVSAIKRKYDEQGRLLASVEIVEGDKPGDTRVVYRITEGRVVKVSGVDFTGNKFVSGERLRTQLATSRTFFGMGGEYTPQMIQFDKGKLEEYFKTYGFQDVRVVDERIFEGIDRVRIVFHIDEGPQYRVGQVDISKGTVFEEDRVRAITGLKPGQVYDKNVVQADLNRIKALYGNTGRLVSPREQVYETAPGEVAVKYEFQERAPVTVGTIEIIGNDVTRENVIRRQIPLYPGQILTYPDVAAAEANLARLGIFEADPEKGERPQVIVLDPDGDNPVKNLLVKVQEAPTGSFLLGVGVNSDAGLSGSIVLNEKNFDITRIPTSLDELLSGRAFRGGGQEFRVEAVPGTQFQRYSVSLREPSLFDSPYSLGTSGYFFTRGYTEYNEQRLGGRVALGRKLNAYWTATASLRAESVDIFDVPYFYPAAITDYVGTSFLGGGRFALTRDSRDSYLRPTSGSQFEAGYEQCFGTYTFPLYTMEGSKYFTTYERPDGSGKHVLALRNQTSFAGSNTPVYERFYAGGFRSLRGFSFRGVGPYEQGLNVGGTFSFLNSVEYQVPLLASDKLFAVGFVDSGTVESKVQFNDYRVSAGFGFRIQVPMLGPVPIALDFGFPIVKGPSDNKQIFSFWLGFFN
ncbi:MAG: outer membrane protein assembly factor BamA [Gemmataceae bacterium]